MKLWLKRLEGIHPASSLSVVGSALPNLVEGQYAMMSFLATLTALC